MSDFSNVPTVNLIKNLFEQCKEFKDQESGSDSDFEDAVPRKLSNSFGPGSIGKKKSLSELPENSVMKKIEKQEKAPRNFEEWEDMQKLDEDLLDTRKNPEYSIGYKQAVTTEDVYLGLSLKNPSTSSCEDMIIEIKLPEETVKINDMDLKVLPEKIDLKTPIYRLKLNLPHKIDPNKSKAEYVSDLKQLKLTLRMKREFDFVNF